MVKSGLTFSHFGIYVRDMETIVQFYVDVMGFFVTDRGMLHGTTPITFLSRDPDQHHQVVFIAGRQTEPTTKLLNQISFKVSSLSELLDFVRNLPMDQVTDLQPLIHGNAWSLYFRDPEGNRVEVFADGDWYITQPITEVLDFSLSEAEIRQQTDEFCKNQPGFRPIEEWRAEMRQLMGA